MKQVILTRPNGTKQIYNINNYLHNYFDYICPICGMIYTYCLEWILGDDGAEDDCFKCNNLRGKFIDYELI